MVKKTTTHEVRVSMESIYRHLQRGFNLPDKKKLISIHIDAESSDGIDPDLVIQWIEEETLIETQEICECLL